MNRHQIKAVKLRIEIFEATLGCIDFPSKSANSDGGENLCRTLCHNPGPFAWKRICVLVQLRAQWRYAKPFHVLSFGAAECT
jgi:hypothetical protein